MKVLCFASAKEITGVQELELTGCQSIREVKVALNKKFPRLESLNYTICVNRTVIHEDKKLSPSDEIAILPPFSGG